MDIGGKLGMSGRLGIRVFRGGVADAPKRSWRDVKDYYAWHAKNWVQYRWRELPFTIFVLMILPWLKWLIPAITVMHSKTMLKLIRGDGSVLDLGTVGRHLVTTAAKNYVAQYFDASIADGSLKFHGFGIGTTAAAIGDTALQSEFTTEYATDNVRPTGSQAHSGATYTTVATVTPDSGGTASIPVTEWGLFSQAATGGGTLYDHQVFAAVDLTFANGDSLQATYVLTLS